MKKNSIRRAAAICMSIFIMTGMFPVQAQAAVYGTAGTAVGTAAGSVSRAADADTADGAAGTININREGQLSGIVEPGTDSAGKWKGSRVVFGSLEGEALVWRVLDSEEMLLQTDSIIEKTAFDQNSNVWKDSEIRACLNSTASFLKEFQTGERNAIKSTGKAAESSTVQGNVSYTNPALQAGNDKVFLLSAAEATSQEYGYGTAVSRKMTVSGGDSAASWWLRSAGNEEAQGAVIGADGKLAAQKLLKDDGVTAEEAGLVPALYLDSTDILFTSPAGSRKAAGFTEISQVTGETVWKLTLCTSDNTMAAGLAGVGNTVTAGESIAVNHNAAASVLTGATQVSAVLTDSSGTPVCYGRINTDTSAVTSAITIPSSLRAGSYKLYVFAEDRNGIWETDYASSMGTAVDITVKRKPVITANPSASALTYGQTLAESALQGGAAADGSTVVPGTFSWNNPGIMPTAADSGTTPYEITFTPQDTSSYQPVILTVRLSVAKAENAPDMPQPVQTVEYAVAKVNQIVLPQGWSWRAEDAEKDLTAGAQTTAVAVYQDTQNYQKYEQNITITRNPCSHAGGTAACTKQAVCDICHQPYGSVDSSHHGESYTINAREATCTEAGYTGDICCRDCGQVLAYGQQIAAQGHSYTSQVTQEATTEQEGIITYTCSQCGHQYTENLGKHTHYYNNEKTIHWLGCVQQGEVEYSCVCGDSYIVVTPALGHDYQVEVTTKATADHAGVKTYTCKRCGYSYAEAIPKLASGGNGGSTGGAVTIAERIPYVKGNSSISGWNDINKAITSAADGETIGIYMNDSLILPAKTLEAMKGRNVTLVLDIGNDMKWSICGSDITGDNLKELNLKVIKNSNAIPQDIVTELAGELDTVQLTLVQDGEFGCTATLQVLLDSKKAGYYANLFHYNTQTGQLDYVGSSQMDGKGIGSLAMTHASDYLVVLDTAVMDGKKETEPAVTDKEENTRPETIPIETLTPEPEEEDDISLIVVFIIVLLVLGAGLLLVAVLRARDREEERQSMQERNAYPQAKNPSVQAKNPSVQAKNLSVQAKNLSVQVKNPSVQAKKAPVQVKNPSAQVKKGSLQTKSPSTQAKKASVQVGNPS